MTTADVAAWRPTSGRASDSPFLLAGTADVVFDLFRDFSAWITLPDEPEGPASPLPRLIRETKEVTGWGQRELASVLRTSHPTIGRLADGRVTVRSRDIAARAAELHAVLVRLARVADGPGALNVALRQMVRGMTALDLLRAEEWSKAYTTALDAIRSDRPTMLRASRIPAKAATRELRP